jgi:hypothetical protein
LPPLKKGEFCVLGELLGYSKRKIDRLMKDEVIE